ncbi:MAG: DNA polymerase ligase N-terminal domain-containing protein, partial [Hyphomicrobiaceae bacterium]
MTGRLDAYRAKRDFTRTSEPDGEAPMVRQAEHLRFVVQKHDATRLHYDLRLEVDGVFRSWAVTRGPSLDPAEKRLAVEVEDHPLEYGDFEGTIPEDVYGGGTVMVWDRGFWAPEDGADPAAALEDGHLKLMLVGSKLKGSWALVRMKPRKGETRHNWLLIKHRDQWATPEKDVLRHDRSVASGRTMAAITKGKDPGPSPFLGREARFGAAARWSSRQPEKPSAVSATPAAVSARRAPTFDVSAPKLTHPDRILWPDVGLTKHDLAEYLLSVAPRMIEHCYGRPCSFVRAPDGIGSETFFQRHAMRGQPKSIHSVVLDEAHEPYLEVD